MTTLYYLFIDRCRNNDFYTFTLFLATVTYKGVAMIIDNKHVVFDLDNKAQAEQYRKIFHPTQVEQEKNVAKIKASFAKSDEGVKRFKELVENGTIRI